MKQPASVSIIHQLSRTGGTVFAKILGNSEEILLLSEVHPSRRGRDIRQQCMKFHKIAIPKSINSYTNCISFLKENTKKRIIIRDLSHQDFLFRRCSLNALSVKLLTDRFVLNRLALVRNPVDQFLSMMNFAPIKKYMSFEVFCRGYIAFNHSIKGVPVIRYEDLIRYPEEVLRTTSSALNINISSSSLNAFHLNKKVTGDNSQDGSRGIDLRDIKALPKRQLYEETCEKMREIPQLKKVCDKLQYNL